MSAIVVEQRMVERVAGEASPALVVVPRPRRRRSWRPLDPDAVVAVLSALPGGAVVAARSADADPGARWLPGLAALVGVPVIRLPADEPAAAATVAIAARPGFAGADHHRGLEVLAVLVADGIAVPPVRPAVLARWASRAWRPCEECAAGGPAGMRCGVCGRRLGRSLS